MSTPLFYPIVRYAPRLSRQGSRFILSELFELAGVPCKATGPSTKREIYLRKTNTPYILSEPHQGAVEIGVAASPASMRAKEYAIAAMAYALFDLVARESIRGNRRFCEIQKVGRPRIGRTRTNAERQRKFRERREFKLRSFQPL